ncbi:unnamed protein product [Musa acuminata subsp. malaccensis]|uniref:(wild Malaysian banana) hypothetical protein n=1 Tax=Musa acuminata subsp. malaccensis TaxID=214687 RepID=A0A8D7AEM3_MUSAM|nr:unnamed protein product [Musa acuminata subsp. malaccensis]
MLSSSSPHLATAKYLIPLGSGRSACWSAGGPVRITQYGQHEMVVEIDFLYPCEGIHRRWDNGYRITATAATWDQAAFVLSVPRRKPVDETQETLRTSAFPSQHVKEKWAKNLYIASVCYGRTVS